MKYCVLMALFFVNAVYANWTVVDHGNFFSLKKTGHDKHRYQIYSSSGTPRFIGEKIINQYFKLVIYDSGTAGTKTLVQINRALVFDRKKNKYLGDYVYQHKSNKKQTQPQWIFDNNKLTITNDSENLHKVIVIEDKK